MPSDIVKEAFSPSAINAELTKNLDEQLAENPRYRANPETGMLLAAISITMSGALLGLLQVLEEGQSPARPDSIHADPAGVSAMLHALADRVMSQQVPK